MTTGALPVYARAPHEYRYALDAAMAVLGRTDRNAVLVRSNVPQLEGEVRQRFTSSMQAPVQAALWLEPMIDSWCIQFEALAAELPQGAPFVIILSLPLARLVPERQSWRGTPIGMHPIAIWRLYRTLIGAGFTIMQLHGIHTASSSVLNLVSRILDRVDRPDLADRVHFAGRLRYRMTGPQSPLSTVALVVAESSSRRTQI